MQIWPTIILGLFSQLAFAQADSVKKISFTAYAEFYHVFPLSNPIKTTRPDFYYNHHRQNEVNANLVYGRFAYRDETFRSNIALAAGTYISRNYSQEPTALQPIFEANAGIQLSNKHELWLDVGIMNAHLGFESAESMQSPTLTRGIAAENSPYFETGANLNFTSKNKQWKLALLLLNGWQRIQKQEANKKWSGGVQIQFQPNEKWLINYSNFVGSDLPDSLHSTRIFHDIFVTFKPGAKWLIIGHLDGGIEKSRLLTEPANWSATTLIIQYQWHRKWWIATRWETYKDPEKIIVKAETTKGIEMSGLSGNIDYQVHPKALLRAEYKHLQNRNPYFETTSAVKHSDQSIALALCVKW
jgi:hypothetical protein